jgi:OOP family OmpA-OmpF porin
MEKSKDTPIGTTDTEETSEQSSNGGSKSDSIGSIRELRKILVGSDEVSEVLPEAVSKSSKSNSALTEATLPIVEENIRESVLRNPRVMADALFPVIGPAIRKAISAALSSMVQSFNQTLEHSVSPKGLRWRFEAMRTGRTFGEVVMLKTLRYRVEQVFLIHRKTGLLLEHAAQNPQDTEDADMVSAMLTAITDFAHDSFKTDQDATLDSFKISGLSVWIESSPDAILAAAIRGNPPLELKETFAMAVEKIQFSFERELDNFDGQAEVFAPAHPILEDCLRFQAEEVKPSGVVSPTNVLLGFLGLIVLLVAGYFAWDYWRWTSLLEDVRNEPGYVLTDYKRGWIRHSVSGLRDPMAGNADEFLFENNYDAGDVEFRWREFQDTEPEFLLERLKKLLKPPSGVKLSVERGILTVDGIADASWVSDAKRLSPLITGVNEVKFTGASQALISKIERSGLLFTCGTATVVSKSAFDRVVGDIGQLALIGSFDLEVVSISDGQGPAETNAEMKRKRASVVGAAIRKEIVKTSNEALIRIEEMPSDVESDECKVTFKVTPQKQ